ncbi:MAG: M1 family metallopeptidase [Flavobacterium sp.]|nr:M1 family metallopeptidase [Flavobacterium sp.]
MTKKLLIVSLFTLSILAIATAQSDRWQQRIKYNINVKMDVVTNRFAGTEKLEYTNNSPDTLKRLFLHLYWNAFQPNSSMDVRSRELGKTLLGTSKTGEDLYDWDSRVKDRIGKLTDAEIGYQLVKSLKINGVAQELVVHETILEVKLSKAILPKTKTLIDLTFEAQVPLQVRRSGRDNAEGVRYSMSQWYPKMVEYDYQGWNANPYIGREFYGVWGDYDVTINIDKTYMIAATGVLQNANAIGYGYDVADVNVAPTASTLTWNFKGENIHDFVWAADPQFKHLSKKVRANLTLHVFYKAKNLVADSAWNNVLWAAEKALPFIEKKFGKYPYPQYSFIQGGDGGMEYAMATLLKGPSLGTVFHEWMHSWYQHVLGTNESLFAWMDEGFTSFAESEVSDYYYATWAAQSPYLSAGAKAGVAKIVERNKTQLPLVQAPSYQGYFSLAKSPYEEPMSTHADHYNTNYAYSNDAYSKGATFLAQLGYIVGDSVRDRILLAYYNEWKFKHPNANDFMRVAEKLSGMQLQWYKEYWINSTKTIDYAVGNIDLVDGKTSINLKRVGKMPMPIDVLLTFKDGSQELHYIPSSLQFGEKPVENAIPRTVDAEWKWTHPHYSFTTTKSIKDLKSIEIDPTQRLADINKTNNKLVVPE